jgi:hypothetical protein
MFKIKQLKPTNIDYYKNIINYREMKEKIKIQKYPVYINDIPQIEQDNNLSIRVYGLSDDLRLSKLYDSYIPNQKINLLLHNNHYSYIKNLNGFMKMFGKNDRCYVCDICGVVSFSRKPSLLKHKLLCLGIYIYI